MNTVGNEALLGLVEQVSPTELRIHATTLDQMSHALRRVAYTNAALYPPEGPRTVRVSSSVHCGNSGTQVKMSAYLNAIFNLARTYLVAFKCE